MLVRQRKRLHGNQRDHKIVRSGNRYYWSIYTPGYPSQGFNSLIKREILKAYGGKGNEVNGVLLQTLILSVSSRCHYSCEHCFEGDNLNENERLSYTELSHVLNDAMRNGVRHVQLGGGEPMLRFGELISLVEQAEGKVDFWLSTSGYGLTTEHAVRLKEAGLTGATISLDHWDEQFHNRFRQHPMAYEWALKAIKSCQQAGIITNLTLCVTRDMANEQDLLKYMELAKNLMVPFVRFLEARKSGNYATKDILLRKHEVEAVLDIYLKFNSLKKYNTYPIIQYPGYHQRKLGCFGAGNRYLHIDAGGDYLGCPFCRSSVGSIRDLSIKQAVSLLQEQGCQNFKTNRRV